MLWLGIDTSNGPLSIALVRDGYVLIEENATMNIRHSHRAMPVIERLFHEADVTPKELDAIAVSEGPGSYTGVRIGVTIAKTLAWTLNKPLIGIPSVKILAAPFYSFDGYICPIIDARRSNVYTGLYRVKNGQVEEVLSERHTNIEAWLKELTETVKEPILFTGQDVMTYQEVLQENFGDKLQIAPKRFWAPRATDLVALAMQRTEEDDVHTFVPEYSRLAEAEANWQKACKRS